MAVYYPSNVGCYQQEPIYLNHQQQQQTQAIFGSKLNFKQIVRIPYPFRGKTVNLQVMASGKTSGLTKQANDCTKIDREENTDVFDDMKQRFLAFKKLKYMSNLEHYKNLADAQAPKTLGFVLLPF